MKLHWFVFVVMFFGFACLVIGISKYFETKPNVVNVSMPYQFGGVIFIEANEYSGKSVNSALDIILNDSDVISCAYIDQLDCDTIFVHKIKSDSISIYKNQQ